MLNASFPPPDAVTPPAEEGAVRAKASGADVPRARAASEIQLQAWIQRVTRQDQAAFAALYEACVGRVYSLALRITRNAAQAEEVAEDTFWQTWREAPRFDSARGTALAWILTIARSRALDNLRARDPAELVEDVEALHEAQCDHHANPLDLLGATQTDHALHQALARLDPQPRQLIALAFFKGLTHDEIAAQTGVPLGTVKSHIRRGLATLKTLLGNDTGQRPEGL
jgi:RNA polymerase sigma factor (sigma-70 family)